METMLQCIVYYGDLMNNNEQVLAFVQGKKNALEKKVAKLTEQVQQIENELAQFPESRYIGKNLRDTVKKLETARIEQSIYANIQL